MSRQGSRTGASRGNRTKSQPYPPTLNTVDDIPPSYNASEVQSDEVQGNDNTGSSMSANRSQDEPEQQAGFRINQINIRPGYLRPYTIDDRPWHKKPSSPNEILAHCCCLFWFIFLLAGIFVMIISIETSDAFINTEKARQKMASSASWSCTKSRIEIEPILNSTIHTEANCTLDDVSCKPYLKPYDQEEKLWTFADIYQAKYQVSALTSDLGFFGLWIMNFYFRRDKVKASIRNNRPVKSTKTDSWNTFLYIMIFSQAFQAYWRQIASMFTTELTSSTVEGMAWACFVKMIIQWLYFFFAIWRVYLIPRREVE